MQYVSIAGCGALSVVNGRPANVSVCVVFFCCYLQHLHMFPDIEAAAYPLAGYVLRQLV